MTVLDDVNVGGFLTTKCENGISYPDGHGIASRKSLGVDINAFARQETKFLQPLFHEDAISRIVCQSENGRGLAFSELGQIADDAGVLRGEWLL